MIPLPKCWHDHPHVEEADLKACLLRYQPGSQDSRKQGCNCAMGHINLSCPVHGAKRRDDACSTSDSSD